MVVPLAETDFVSISDFRPIIYNFYIYIYSSSLYFEVGELLETFTARTSLQTAIMRYVYPEVFRCDQAMVQNL